MKNRKLKKAVTLRTIEDLQNIARALRCAGRFEDGVYLPPRIEATVAKELRPDDATLLDRWLTARHMDVCSVGRRKLLCHARNYTSWKQYFTARWNDGDGIIGWFIDNSSALCGINGQHFDRSQPTFARLLASGTGKPRYSWSPTSLTKQSWEPWPFPAKKRAARKTVKRRGR